MPSKSKRKRIGGGIEFRHDPPRWILLGAVSSAAQAEEEKGSLDDQFTVLKKAVEDNKGVIVDTIYIPGASRDVWTWDEFCALAAGQQIYDPQKMIDHWNNADFDVLAVINASRFARTQSILHEIIGRTYEDAKAYIFTSPQQIIPFEQRHIFGMLEGHRVSGEITEIVRRRDVGMRARVVQGLPLRTVPHFHRVTFDKKGDPVRTRGADGSDYFMTVDREQWDRLINDLYDAYVEKRIGGLALELYLSRLSPPHLRGNGRRYHSGYFLEEMWNPAFHGVLGFPTYAARERWAVDEAYAHEAPATVTMNYHACEPVYIGERGVLFRRQMFNNQDIKGKNKPYASHRFTGLAVCSLCGCSMHYHKTKTATGSNIYYYCGRDTRVHNGYDAPPCPNRKGVYETTLMAFVEVQLRRLAAGRPFIPLEPGAPPPSLESLIKEREVLQSRIDNLWLQLADLTPGAAKDGRTLLERLSEQRDGLDKSIRQGERAVIREDQSQSIISSADILNMLDDLWDMPETECNQFLSQVFGDWKVVCNDGECLGLRLTR